MFLTGQIEWNKSGRHVRLIFLSKAKIFDSVTALQNTTFNLPAANRQLPTADCKLPTEDCQLPPAFPKQIPAFTNLIHFCFSVTYICVHKNKKLVQ